MSLIANSRQLIKRGSKSSVSTFRTFSSRNIFDSSKDEEELEKHNLGKKQQLPSDKPWDGEEPVGHSVLRMIIDKFNKPLRVEGAAKMNLPKPQSDYVPPPEKKEKSSQIKKIEREKKQVEMKQKRILNAKDSAFDYSMNQKYPTNNVTKAQYKKDIDWNDWEDRKVPRSINEIGLLADEKIRAARARGEFDNIAGRGKPIVKDHLLVNPFVDTTEYFLNRIIQRNGAAPPWVMMQQQVDTEIDTFRNRMSNALNRCVNETKEHFTTISKANLLREFEKIEKSYFNKELDRINKSVRSYNVMCPNSVRKPLLDLDQEIRDMFNKHGYK